MSTWSKLISSASVIVALALGAYASPARAIAIQDALASSLFNSGSTANTVFSGTEAYTVTSGANYLVVVCNSLVQTNGPGGAGPTETPMLSWVTSSTTQTVTPTVQEVSTGSTTTFAYADIYCILNPAPGAGTLSFATTARTAALGAFTLNGVSTSATLVTGGSNGTSGTSIGASLAVNTNGSFAAVSECDTNNSSNAYTLATTSGIQTQQWSFWDNNRAEFGGGYVSGLAVGQDTVTWTNTQTQANRNEIAAVVFTPAPAIAWSATGGGSWNLASNWGGTVPSGTAAAAAFNTGNPTVAAAVTLDAVITLNSLALSNSNQITISPGSGGSLTFASGNGVSPIVNVTAGSPIISASASLNANTAFTISSGATLTVGGNIANGTAPSGISLAGGGTLVLGGNNSYSGTTSLTAGAMNVSGSLGNTPVFVSGGTLSLQSPGAVSQNVVNISGGGSLVETASNALSGSAVLTVGNSSSAILSQANNYSGTTTVTKGGLLQLGMPGALYAGNTANWTPANISVAGSATLAVNIGGPNDFTQPQAATLLTNLSASTSSSGLAASAFFGLDTTNATATVTFGGQIADTTAGRLNFTKRGSGTLVLPGPNSYSGSTLVNNGELILAGANTATAGTMSTLSAVNTVPAGATILSIRNAAALGSGTANSSLAPITLNATGGNLSTSILEIGAKIGTDPGPYNADFSYQVVAPASDATGTAVLLNPPAVAGPGQIILGFLGNSDDGTGFAALTASTTSAPRIVALYDPTSGTLATLAEKTQFGQGSGDHLTMGSPTANNTLVLENPIDFQGGPSRRWASIRGVGIVPEGQYAGAIINSKGGTNNINFDGNGGLIFDSAATTYTATTTGGLQINGGAVFIAANDPAQGGTPGALGEGTSPIQVGTSLTVNPAGGAVPTVAGANVAFMTYGPNAGIGSVGVTTNRSINVGGSDVTYASATLGGMTDDWTQMNGSISLNESPTNATTFTARNGGRVDFGGTISGSGSVVVGNSIVEGDATSPGIAVNNNGTIVFVGACSYTGSTAVTAGKLYVNGSIDGSILVTVGAGATLGGTGSISSPVNVSSGGILEGGQLGSGTLTLSSSVTFNGPASVYLGGTPPAVGSPALVINGIDTLNTNGNPVTINIASITGTGDYALIGYSGVQSAPSNSFTLGELPNRANGTLVVNGNELDLDVTSLAAFIRWTGTASTSWDTTSINWTIPGVGSTHYLDNPGDAVVFDDSAAPHTSVTINGADVHPSSVTFNNNNSTYTISGTNAIAGSTGLQLTGTGTVVVLNTNTFTGATSIGAGATLQLGNGAPGSDGSISHTSGITDNGTLLYQLAGAQSYGGVIGGSGSLSLQSGMLTLTGSNTYSGATTVGGTLQLGSGAVNQDGSLAGNITNNGALVFDYFGSQTYTGVISGSGAVTKNGVGTLTLAGNNSYSVGTQLNLGSLQLASQGAIQNSTLTIGPFASLTFAGGVSNFNIGGLTGSGGISLTASDSSAATLIVGGNGPNATYSGVISGIGSLTLPGSNSMTLSGTNSYSGGTTINGGTLVATNSNSLGAVGEALLIGAATLEVAANIAEGRNLNFTDPAATIQVDASQSYNNTGMLSGGGNLNKTGAGLLVLAGTSYNAPPTTVSGGTLLANGPSMALGTVTVSGSSVFGGNGSAGDTTVLNGGKIDVSANSGSMLSLSSLTLGQSATDSSTFNFSAGNPAIPQLAIANALTANSGSDSVTVNVGASGALVGTYTLATYSSLNGTGSSAFVLGSQTGLSIRDQGALLVTGTAIDYVVTGYNTVWRGTQGSGWTTANNWARGDTGAPTTFLPGDNVVFDDSAGTTVGGTTNVTISGTGDVSPASVTFNNNAYNYTISGPFGIGGNGAMTLNGTGRVTLSSSNTYSGGTNINAGTLIAANSSGVATGGGPVNINGGTLQIGNGGATGALGAGLVNNNSVLAFSRSDTALVVANTISGTGSVVQLGPGMTTLTASNTYTGPTSIAGGTLKLRSATTTVPVTAGLLYELDPSSSANYTLTSGNVTTLTNIAGNPNYSFTNPASTVTVATGVSGFNGKPVLNFSGNATTATLTMGNSTSPQTVFIVEQVTGVTGANGIGNIWGNTGNDTNIRTKTGPIFVAGSGDNGNDYTNSTGSTYLNGVLQTGNFAAGTPQLIDAYVGTGLANGLPWGSTALSNGTFLTRSFTGYMGEVVAYSTVLSTSDRQAVEAYLMSKWLGVGSGGGLGGNVLPVDSAVTISNGGTLDMTNEAQTIASLSSTDGKGSMVLLGFGVLTVENSASTVFDGVISDGPGGSGGSLIKQGAGSLTLTGYNTYTGGTTIQSGVLQMGSSAAIGTGALAVNGGSLDLAGYSATVPSFSGAAGLVTNNGASNSLLTVNQGTTATTFSGTISDGPTNKVALTLNTSGTGELVLDGSNTYSGATTISGSSTLQLGNADNAGSIGNSAVTDNGSLVVSRSDSVNLTSLISGALGGTGSLTLVGGGTLTLTGTNTYSGGTVVNTGTMIVTNPAAIFDGTNLTVGDATLFPAPVVPAPVAGSAAAAVPEPGTLALVAATVLSIGIWRRKGGRRSCAKRPSNGC